MSYYDQQDNHQHLAGYDVEIEKLLFQEMGVGDSAGAFSIKYMAKRLNLEDKIGAVAETLKDMYQRNLIGKMSALNDNGVHAIYFPYDACNFKVRDALDRLVQEAEARLSNLNSKIDAAIESAQRVATMEATTLTLSPAKTQELEDALATQPPVAAAAVLEPHLVDEVVREDEDASKLTPEQVRTFLKGALEEFMTKDREGARRLVDSFHAKFYPEIDRKQPADAPPHPITTLYGAVRSTVMPGAEKELHPSDVIADWDLPADLACALIHLKQAASYPVEARHAVVYLARHAMRDERLN